MTRPVRALVTDIEGTTTSISFVKETLFPYSRERLRGFVAEERDSATVRAALEELKSIAGDPTMSDEDATARAVEYIDEDRKLAPLKALQGMVWEDGYKTGAYRAHVYPDVAPRLKAFREAGIKLYVYSSGSVFAQQLLYQHTLEGDLTPLFSGYFDTTTGPKKDKASYEKIAKALGESAEHILFLSDSYEELDAAVAAGFQTVGLDRSTLVADQRIGSGGHTWVRDFTELDVSPHPPC